jgi:hypothetical protein
VADKDQLPPVIILRADWLRTAYFVEKLVAEAGIKNSLLKPVF